MSASDSGLSPEEVKDYILSTFVSQASRDVQYVACLLKYCDESFDEPSDSIMDVHLLLLLQVQPSVVSLSLLRKRRLILPKSEDNDDLLSRYYRSVAKSVLRIGKEMPEPLMLNLCRLTLIPF